jgi:hypothetical protein
VAFNAAEPTITHPPRIQLRCTTAIKIEQDGPRLKLVSSGDPNCARLDYCERSRTDRTGGAQPDGDKVHPATAIGEFADETVDGLLIATEDKPGETSKRSVTCCSMLLSKNCRNLERSPPPTVASPDTRHSYFPPNTPVVDTARSPSRVFAA